METSAPTTRGDSRPTRAPAATHAHRSGWVTFAGVTMLILGSLDVIWGIAAIANSEVVIVGGRGVMVFDIATWGWVQLILGAVVALTGLGLLGGYLVARVVGIFLLSFNAVLQVVWFSAAPLWALMMIALDIVIIYQLITDWVEDGNA